MAEDFITVTRSGTLFFLCPGWEDLPGDVPVDEIWRQRRGEALPVRSAGRAVRIKRKRRGGLTARFLPDTYSPSRVEALRLRYLTASERGLPVPRLIGLASREAGRGRVSLAVITEEVPECQTLAEQIQAGRAEGKTMRVLGDSVRALHLAGCLHGDLNAMNVITPTLDRSFVFLDMDDARYYPECVPESAGRREIIRLARSMTKLLHRAAREAAPPRSHPLTHALFEGYVDDDPGKALLLQRHLRWTVFLRGWLW